MIQMEKKTIKEMQENLKQKTELLQLNNHRTLHDYVIVVPLDIQEPGVTSRASQFEDRPDVGLVVGVGEKIENIPVGSVVFFGRYSHVQLTHDDIIYLIMRAEDVYCVAD